MSDRGKNYIIAYSDLSSVERHPSQPAVHLLSKPEEHYSRYCEALSRLVLAAVHLGDIGSGDADTLIACIQDRRVPFRFLNVFEMMTGDKHSHEYVTERNELHIAQGAVGELSTRDVLHELSLSQEIGNDDGIENITADGLHSLGFSEGTIEPHLYEVDEIPHYELELRGLATSVGATAYGYQYELVHREGVPALLSERQHQVLGEIDKKGSFVPLLTVLDSSHPARAKA